MRRRRPREDALGRRLALCRDLVPELCLVAEKRGEVVVVGHPAYCPHFGSELGAAFAAVDPFGGPPDDLMVYLLPAYTPEARGRVSYAEALPLGG